MSRCGRALTVCHSGSCDNSRVSKFSAPSAAFAPQNVVFLHAGWRCASTYVWSRFRALQSTTCFYEPFAENLSALSSRRIDRESKRDWRSRHPALGAPYRTEYRPLLRPVLRGVPGYHQSFALAGYFPRGEACREAAYLRRLIEHAHRRETVPVLGFSRSLARAAQMKSALGGYHIVLRRAARQQWLSCRSYRGAEPLSYFEVCHFLILALAPADSPAGRFAESLGVPRPPWRAWDVRRQIDALRSRMGACGDALSYRVFLAVQLLSQAAAAQAADLSLDVDRLSASAAYRAGVHTRILAATGLAVDFGDCHLPRHETTDAEVDFAAAEADVRQRLLDCGVDSVAARAEA